MFNISSHLHLNPLIFVFFGLNSLLIISLKPSSRETVGTDAGFAAILDHSFLEGLVRGTGEVEAHWRIHLYFFALGPRDDALVVKPVESLQTGDFECGQELEHLDFDSVRARDAVSLRFRRVQGALLPLRVRPLHHLFNYF